VPLLRLRFDVKTDFSTCCWTGSRSYTSRRVKRECIRFVFLESGPRRTRDEPGMGPMHPGRSSWERHT
jgi:hypothetical protein